MEWILFIVAVGLMIILWIVAYKKLDHTVRKMALQLYYDLTKELEANNDRTRKDQQEIKTRLTNDRKRQVRFQSRVFLMLMELGAKGNGKNSK